MKIKTKINKWDLTKLKSFCIAKKNIGRTFLDTNHSKIFFGPPPGVMKIKTKINKWDLIKLKCICTVKENINT